LELGRIIARVTSRFVNREAGSNSGSDNSIGPSNNTDSTGLSNNTDNIPPGDDTDTIGLGDNTNTISLGDDNIELEDLNKYISRYIEDTEGTEVWSGYNKDRDRDNSLGDFNIEVSIDKAFINIDKEDILYTGGKIRINYSFGDYKIRY
jgi:hypothetical protein